MTTAFRRLAVVTAVFAYLQITLGALVRVSGSGLGCPDWPLCQGRPYPPANLHSIIEYSHRAVGSVTGILIVATLVGAWLIYRRRSPLVAWVATAAGVAVLAEGLLGGLVVYKELPGWLVMAHLALALLILGLLVATAVMARPAPTVARDRSFSRLAIAATAGAYLIVLSGGTVVASQADDVCKSWPLCGGGFQPDFAGVGAYNMLHRFTAAVLGLLILHVIGIALRRRRQVPGMAPLAALTGVALLIQGVFLGIAVAVTHDNPAWNGLHIAFGTAVWAGLAALTTLSLRGGGETERAPTLALERGARA